MSEDGGAQTAAPPAAGTGPRKLEGRVAIVTGGNRGIGAAICRSLGREGAVVAAGYSSNKDQAAEFLSEMQSEGIEGSVHQGNIGKAEDCQRVIDEVMEQHGRIDILVNNAGITADTSVLKMSAEDWQKVLDVNLSGAFHMSKPALAHMIERGSGRIVHISSVIGEQGNPGQANYAAAKSGLFGLSMTMAREAAQALGKQGKLEDGGLGVTVNTVAPGFIQTDMTKDLPEKVTEAVKATIPLGRLGQPEEIARVVHFLCSDASSYITGQVWSVNGGMNMS